MFRYLHAAWARLRGPRWVTLNSGITLHLDPRQFMDRIVLRDGAWEPALTGLIRRVVRPGDACLDVGAHVGYVTCTMAQAVGPGGRVLAVEPDPRAFAKLRGNLNRNGFAHVMALPMAWGGKEGAVILTLTQTLGWTTAHPNSLASADAIGSVTVPMGRGDHYSGMLEDCPLTFAKVDAEGSEPEIWQGLTETLSRHRPIVAMEVNYQSLRAAATSVAELSALLQQSGYTEAYMTTPDGLLEPLDYAVERPLLVDAVFVHPASPVRDRLTSAFST